MQYCRALPHPKQYSLMKPLGLQAQRAALDEGSYPVQMPHSILGRSIWRRLITVVAAGVLALLLLADAVLATAQARWPLLAAGLLTGAAALSPGRLAVRAGIGAVCSWFASIWLRTTAGSGTWGLAESAALLLLILATSRSAPARVAVPSLVALGGAMAAQPFRLGDPSGLLFSLLLTVAVTGAVALGSALRWRDQRRERDLQAVRQDERLNLARELHDFVAHHVTGIVVQAQAAQVVAAGDAAAVMGALQAIERAGTEALRSMRQLVGVLRGGAVRIRPEDGMRHLRALVDGFTQSSTGPAAVFDVGSDVMATDLPPALATAVHRVVQESLTNVRRHAADATTVWVGIHRTEDHLEVRIRDDSRSTGRFPGVGVGLVGLAERVDLLGGTLQAGPRPEGGWEVLATLPIAETAG